MPAKQNRLTNEIERIDEGGDTWESSTPTTEPVAVKRPLDTILRVRFSADQFHQLDELALTAGIGPSTLVRMWILERLREPIKR